MGEVRTSLNGRPIQILLTGVPGLQCHTAQHSWKLVFLCGQQLYELILTACTDKEELEWRTRLEDNQKAAVTNCQDQAQPEVLESLSLNIRALGTVFRKQGRSHPPRRLVKRMS
jgi:hypothetical protein